LGNNFRFHDVPRSSQHAAESRSAGKDRLQGGRVNTNGRGGFAEKRRENDNRQNGFKRTGNQFSGRGKRG